jgi:DTW domain-containing protein YfiP
MKKASIVCGETSEDFEPLIKALRLSQSPCYLIYPQPDCQFVESIGNKCQPSTLLFIDGSWKKSYKLLQLNPWLTKLPSISFCQADKTRYQIRKAHRDDSLSTLEAVAYCLDHLDDVDTKPLHQAFDAMIDNQWRFMSDTVKQRYIKPKS